MLVMDESFQISKLVFDKKIELKIRSNSCKLRYQL